MTRSELQRAADFIRAAVAIPDSNNPLGGVHLVEMIERRATRRARTKMLTAGIVACLVVTGTWMVPQLRKAHGLTYRVDGSSELGVVGSYVNVSKSKPVDLQFSEGSHIVFEPKSRGRVAQTTSVGATMILEDGRAQANIVHRDKTDWLVYAGPYVVSVTGTSFDVSYEVATQTFELDMHSGTVRISGPGLVNPVEVRNTQHVVLSPSSAESAHVNDSTNSSAANTTSSRLEGADRTSPQSVGVREPVAPEPANDGGRVAKREKLSVPATATDPATMSWRLLSASGQHRRIVELAEERGVDVTTSSASASDLLALGNAARFAGKPVLATKAYRALRVRFVGSDESSAAAFFLGRLSETSDPTEAIGWYDRYVAEAAAGTWVAEAQGRRMVILYKTRGMGAAEPAAQDYLARFPSGPYAGFAQKILGH